MPHYALKIEYDGAPFQGWQRQTLGQASVQAAIEQVLDKVEPSTHRIVAAGRTDAGVHALGQVASVTMIREWDSFRLREALNHHLRPLPVAIVAVARVDDDFHARFSAFERQYIFRLVSRRAPLTYDRGKIWHIRHPLNIDAMREGAAYLIGSHDFTTFRASMCQAKSPVKTLDEITVTQIPYATGDEYRFFLRARSFLHNQVRSIVGSLERVGAGAWPAQQIKQALDAKDRTHCGPVSPPDGLYLSRVLYEKDPFIGA